MKTPLPPADSLAEREELKAEQNFSQIEVLRRRFDRHKEELPSQSHRPFN